MAKTQPTGDLRGLLIPEAGTLTATYSATSQAGPRAGPVVPDQTTGLLLHASGALDASSEAAQGGTMGITTLTGGGVGTGAIRWAFSGDTLRSWDPPVMLAGWEYIDRSTTASRYRCPHVIRRASTGLPAVVATKNTNDVVVNVADNRGKWTAATVEALDAQTRACLVDLPNGRILCIYVVSASSSTTQVRMAYSDDDGATWTTGASSALVSSIPVASSAVVRIRAVYLAGQISMLIHYVDGGADQVYQYASSDGGCRFVTVGVVGVVARGYPDMIVSQGSIFVAILRYSASYSPVTIQPWVYRLSSASQPLSSIEGVEAATSTGNEVFGTYAAGAFTAGELALLAMDDGTLYVYGVDFAGGGTGEVITRVSTNRGATWDQNLRNSHGAVNGTVIHYSGVGTTAWRDLSVAPERGRAIMAHATIGTVTGDYTSLSAAYLGGWSTVGMPAPGSQDAWEVAGWDDTYVPIDLPDDSGPTWTRSFTGAATETLGSGGVTVSCTGADRGQYLATPVTTGYEADGVILEYAVLVTSGTATAEVRISDGTNAYVTRVDATTTGVDLRDVTAGTSIGTVTVDCTKGVVIRIAVAKAAGAWSTNVGKVRAWVRLEGPYSGGTFNFGPRQDREWTSIGTTSTLQSVASATNRIRWGSVSLPCTSTWRSFVFTAGRETAGNNLDSPAGTARGHLIPPAGSPVHLVDGLRLHGVDGPTVAGDTWTTTADFSYPIKAINPAVSPSPRRVWRSTSDAVQQDIILTGLDMGARSGDLYGLYLAGCNWRTATLYRDSTGTNRVCDIDLSAQLTGMDFVRNRRLIYPVSGAGVGMPFYAGAQRLEGATVEYTQTGGGSPVVVRTVAGNTSGAWVAATAVGSYASTRLELESYEAADPTSGTLTLRMPSAVILFDALVGTDTLMLRIPAQVTPDDYMTIGTMIVGRVRLFGRQYSRGRGLTFTPAYELSETSSGTRRARALGPTRRAMEMSWDDGVDTSGLHTPGTPPDYYGLGYSGADGLTAIADTGRTLAGIIAQTEGAVLPVVVLPAIQQQASAPGTTGLQLLNPEAHLYGRIVTETLRVDSDASVRGQELRDPGEVVQISTVIVEEEL
jgi:hypothetical protein